MSNTDKKQAIMHALHAFIDKLDVSNIDTSPLESIVVERIQKY